jgi:hypothetical protein
MTVLQYHRLPVLAHQHRPSFSLFVCLKGFFVGLLCTIAILRRSDRFFFPLIATLSQLLSDFVEWFVFAHALVRALRDVRLVAQSYSKTLSGAALGLSRALYSL